MLGIGFDRGKQWMPRPIVVGFLMKIIGSL